MRVFYIISIIIDYYNQTVAYLLEGVVEIQKFGVVQIVHDGDFVFDHVPAKKSRNCCLRNLLPLMHGSVH